MRIAAPQISEINLPRIEIAPLPKIDLDLPEINFVMPKIDFSMPEMNFVMPRIELPVMPKIDPITLAPLRVNPRVKLFF
jgi:hypothetical protein